MGEAGFVKLVCPSCAGTLGVGAAHDILVCGSCGTSFKVERSGSEVALEEVTDSLAHLTGALQIAESQLTAHERHVGDVTTSYDQRIRAAGRAGARVLLRATLAAAGTFLATYVVFIIPYGLSHPGYDAIPLWYRVSAGISGAVAAIAVATIVLRRSAARRRGAVAALQTERAAAVEAAMAPGPALAAQVAALRRRLAENRRILES